MSGTCNVSERYRVALMVGGVMVELNSEIARLEKSCEQLVTHLRAIDRNSADECIRRADLYAMLKELARLKRKRERLEDELCISLAA